MFSHFFLDHTSHGSENEIMLIGRKYSRKPLFLLKNGDGPLLGNSVKPI
jgi:hypothetical protein